MQRAVDFEIMSFFWNHPRQTPLYLASYEMDILSKIVSLHIGMLRLFYQIQFKFQFKYQIKNDSLFPTLCLHEFSSDINV